MLDATNRYNRTNVRHHLAALKRHPWRCAFLAAMIGLAGLYALPVTAYLLPRPLVVLWLISAGVWPACGSDDKLSAGALLVLTVAFSLLTLYFLPATDHILCGSLESRHPAIGKRPSGINAIVVLAGGLQGPDAEGLPVEPGPNTLYRCLLAAEMYRQGPRAWSSSAAANRRRIIRTDLARVMRDFLIREGIDSADIIEEDASSSTHENAVLTSGILRAGPGQGVAGDRRPPYGPSHPLFSEGRRGPDRLRLLV